MKSKKRRTRCGLLRSWRATRENWDGVRRLSLVVAMSERRRDHRDFERWCFRIEAAADTISAAESEFGDEENEMSFGKNRTQRIDFRKLIENAMISLRNFIEQFASTKLWKRELDCNWQATVPSSFYWAGLLKGYWESKLNIWAGPLQILGRASF